MLVVRCANRSTALRSDAGLREVPRPHRIYAVEVHRLLIYAHHFGLYRRGITKYHVLFSHFRVE